LPVVGEVEVGGLTFAQAEEAIIAAHVPDVVTELAVFIQLADRGGTSVLVLGAATQPGLVLLDSNQRNLLYALQQVGGFNPAATGTVRLRPIRPERPEVAYNLNDINDVRRALQAPPLEPGDMLIVEAAAPSAVYVTGLVNAPGAISLPPGSKMSALQAVSTAGGTQPYLDVKEATLIRELENGERVHVKVDYQKLKKGEIPDVQFAAGDILHLPHTPDTMFQEWFTRNVLIGPFSVGVRYDPLQQYNTNRAIDADDDGSFSDTIRRSISTTIPEIFIPPPQGVQP
jgi:polysaccharide export outer membrane protein